MAEHGSFSLPKALSKFHGRKTQPFDVARDTDPISATAPRPYPPYQRYCMTEGAHIREEPLGLSTVWFAY